MNVFLICGLTFAILANAGWAFWKGEDDSDWEQRYRDLDDLDRVWIAAASRTSTTQPVLKERGEVGLAAGYRRREVRRRARIALAASPIFILAAVFFAAGLVPAGVVGLSFGAYGLVAGLLDFRRARHIKARYREIQNRYLVIAGVDAGGAPHTRGVRTWSEIPN